MNIFSHLTLMQRFAALAVAASATICILAALFLNGLWAQREVASRALAGTPAALSLQELASQLQRHRFYSGRLLSNDTSVAEQQQVTEKEIAHLLRRLEHELAPLSVHTSVRSALEAISQRHDAIVADVREQKITVRESFDRHGDLLRTVDDLSAQVLVASGLLLDADPGRHLFVVAGFQEGKTVVDQLAQLHELGTMVLTNKGASPLDLNQLAAIHARLQDRERFFEQTLMLAHQHGSRLLTPALEAALERSAAGIRQTLERVQDTFLGVSPDWSVTPGDYGNPIGQAIEAQQVLTRGIAQKVVAELHQHERRLAWLFGAVLAGLALLLVGLGRALWALVRSIVHPLQISSEQARRMAAGNLTVALTLDVQHEVGQTLGALERMRQDWVTVLAGVQEAAGTAAAAARELQQGNDQLAQRTERAAQQLQCTVQAIEGLLQDVGRAAAGAQQACDLAERTATAADRGGATMQEVIAMMESIHRHSSRIEDIIGVIDGIAFQTNILALNAAIEAARAGSHGRGFAVVASEVRSLAQRSASAAREIKTLIQVSVLEVDQGMARIRDAGVTMDDIVGKVRQVRDRMLHLAALSQEQQTAIALLAQSAGELDQLTQQNAALAEESTAATDSLAKQAALLQRAVQHFRLPPQAVTVALPAT